MPPALEAWSLNHWMVREVPDSYPDLAFLASKIFSIVEATHFVVFCYGSPTKLSFI